MKRIKIVMERGRMFYLYRECYTPKNIFQKKMKEEIVVGQVNTILFQFKQ